MLNRWDAGGYNGLDILKRNGGETARHAHECRQEQAMHELSESSTYLFAVGSDVRVTGRVVRIARKSGVTRSLRGNSTITPPGTSDKRTRDILVERAAT